MIFRDRTGQVWLLGFEPYQYPAIVVGTRELSSSLVAHAFVRLDAGRGFEVEESFYHVLEDRSDMKRMA